MAWIGALVGLAGTALSSSGSGDSATQSKEPWGKVQPWLEDNIATGQQLQNYYAQNPFNSIQHIHLHRAKTDKYRCKKLPAPHESFMRPLPSPFKMKSYLF